MVIEDLYRKFNELMNKRNYPRVAYVDRVPPQRVLDSWCEDMNMYKPFKDEQWTLVGEDPKLCRQLCVMAMCIKIAKEQGMAAATLYKLQQG